MNLIPNITSSPNQTKTVVLASGLSFKFTMKYIPQQFGWFITNITYQTFVLNTMRIGISPNMLFQYKNIIPFGIACFSTVGREPSQLQDFASGAANLYLLTADECKAYATYLESGVLPT